MITLFHAGYNEIIKPDVHFGRKNADFGQGFYTTDDKALALGWVRQRPGADIIINRYELDERGLKIKEFQRNREWFEYIFANRRAKPDAYEGYDLIKGPIANDTIYETYGIITSGYLSNEEAVKLLLVGPCFRQIALKSWKAAEKLKFVSSEVLSKEAVEEVAGKHGLEEAVFQESFAEVMQKLNVE